MGTSRKSPGPAARHAFRIGVRVAAIGGLAVIGALYWLDVLTLLLVGFTLVVIFPVYMLVVASVLSKWLGFDKDMSDLRPVSRDESAESEQGRGPW